MPTPDHIRPATPEDLPFLMHLARRYSNQIGFLPAAGVANYIDAGHVHLATENADEAGYLLWRPPSAREPHVSKIVQTAVCLDARRRHHGLALVDALARTAVTAGASILQACVRRNLEANAFFAAAGFTAVALRTAPTARAEPHVIWRRPLTAVTPRVLRTIAAPYRCQGPGGKFLPATAVDAQFRVRPLSRHELQALMPATANVGRSVTAAA